MVNCPYCSREFTNAKRHATHVAACKSNPRSDAAIAAASPIVAPNAVVAPSIIEMDGVSYFRADELVDFYPGVKGGRDVIEKSGVPDNQHAYATLAPKRGVWSPSNDKVKVARALVRAQWARASVPGLAARLDGSTTQGVASPAAPLVVGGGGSTPGSTKVVPTIGEVTETLRLKAAELDLGRAQVALLGAQASERRAAELHTKELDALDRRTAAYIASFQTIVK